MHKKIGFFTRLLDDVPAAERYRLALEQIQAAEAAGFDTAWVAQHHFSASEGGLPSPFPFLAHVAGQTRHIRLGTGVITLAMEDPVRMAEDAAVTDILSGGRLEIGFGSGGNPRAFAGFGRDFADRHRLYDTNLATVKSAWAGAPLAGGMQLWPAGQGLDRRSWQATFSVDGGRKAGAAGDGLMLSRTQPRPEGREGASLADLQSPIVDAYLSALPAGTAPRIMASRAIFVADDRATADDLTRVGLGREVEKFRAMGYGIDDSDLARLKRSFDQFSGTPEDVAEALGGDPILSVATEVAMQAHSVDPPHAFILRSVALFAARVAPLMGWKVADADRSKESFMKDKVHP